MTPAVTCWNSTNDFKIQGAFAQEAPAQKTSTKLKTGTAMRFNSITVADHPDAWRRAGFTVVDDKVVIGRSLVFNLTGPGDDGTRSVCSWELGIDDVEPASYAPGNLSLQAAAPSTPSEGHHLHDNGVRNCMKAVILCSNTRESVDRLIDTVDGFAKPAMDQLDDKGIHFAIWMMEGCEVGLEMVSLDPNQGDDAMMAIFLVVDDLKATIECIGENDVTPIEVYGGREMVRIKPRIGVTPGICLIEKA